MTQRYTKTAIIKKLGIVDIEADVLPAHKEIFVTKLKGEGRVVAMAGDGLNNAPVLAVMHCGCATQNSTTKI